MLVCNPFAMLHKAVAQGCSFSDFIKLRLAKHGSRPDKPWKLVLYADEVVPGDVLSADNRRKIWVAFGARPSCVKQGGMLVHCAGF